MSNLLSKTPLSGMKRTQMLGIVVTIGALFLSTTIARAQEVITVGGDGMQSLPPEVSSQIQDMINKVATRQKALLDAHTARLAPGLITVDPTKGTATFDLSNQSDDTLRVTLKVGVEPRVPVAEPDLSKLPPEMAAKVQAAMEKHGTGGSSGSASKGGNPLLDSDEAATPATEKTKAEAVEANRSLSSWIKDLPAEVKLLPREKKSITIRVAKPANAEAGKYGAWIVAVTNLTEIKMPPLESTAQIKMVNSPDVTLPKNALQSSAKVELLVGQ